MVKSRKIKVGDFVNYAAKEWIVSNRSKTHYRLVRRQVKTGSSIVVPKKRVKLADQTWRSNLTRGDPIELFLGGQWINASVFERHGKTLVVQPSLSNFTMPVSEDAGIIDKGSHTHPLWGQDIVTPVVIDGTCHIERARGLVFPWSYTSEGATRVEVSGPLRTPLTTLTFAHYDTGGFPLKMYKNLTTAEIMHDACSKDSKHPELLRWIAEQWCHSRLPIYPYLRNYYGLRFYITQALAHGDQRRVQEMLSVGEDSGVFHKSEWTIREHLSHPYIEAEFTVVNNTLKVDLFHSGIKIDKTPPTVKKILERISTPMVYAPKKISVDAAPEMQFLLSRMLGMEKEPVELLSTRKINNSKVLVNLEEGFSEPEMKLCGGQLRVEFVNFPVLVTELMKRSPMRTLIIVEKDALPIWKDFKIYHGRNRGFEPVTVTTKAMFTKIARTQRIFDKTERLIVMVDSYWFSSFVKVALNFRCKIKWAVCHTYWRNSYIFKTPEKNTDLSISLTRDEMEDMGVEFPTVSHQFVIFDVDPETTKVFIQRLKARFPSLTSWRFNLCQKLLAQYLQHPELVPLEFRGQKLAAVEATLANISEKFGVSEQVLNSRAQETCSVCLEKITDASVTPCGHIFCSECMQELHKRQINCPMCRSKITSFLKLSDKDTDGKIEVEKGVAYRIPETEKWGKKMEFLKKHKDAIIITGGTDIGKELKRKIKKVLRKRTILTVEEMTRQQHLLKGKIIMMVPTHAVQNHMGIAWGKDIELIELKYKLPKEAFGREFY